MKSTLLYCLLTWLSLSLTAQEAAKEITGAYRMIPGAGIKIMW